MKEAGVGEDKQITPIGNFRKKRRSMYFLWIGLGLLIDFAVVLAMNLRRRNLDGR